MLRTLRRAWERYVASIPKSEFVDSIPESQWDRADLRPPVSKARRKAFTDLLALICSHLPPEEAATLSKIGANALTHSDDFDSALRNALFPEDDQENSENRGFIACDWKAAQEVQWQAELLCRAHGISATWQAPKGTLTGSLQDFDRWLQHQGRHLLCFAVGDSLVAFALPIEHVASATALGKKLRLAISTPSEA